MYADLSPYEIARLKNIQENKKKLAELGLLGTSNPLKPKKNKVVFNNSNGQKKRRQTSNKNNKSPSTERKKIKVGTRRSSRLAGIKISDTKNIVDKSHSDKDLFDGEEEEELGVNYDINPQMPQELDDYEFEIYTIIRRWRIERKNELQIEPYKICQNRTICELIRRRRNNKNWALATSETRPDELIDCWGIGPSKSETYGVEMIEIVDKWEETLEKSRSLN